MDPLKRAQQWHWDIDNNGFTTTRNVNLNRISLQSGTNYLFGTGDVERLQFGRKVLVVAFNFEDETGNVLFETIWFTSSWLSNFALKRHSFLKRSGLFSCPRRMKNFRPGVLLNTAKYRGQIAVIL